MKDEAYKTAWGIYHTTYETKGYWFRTPEAWDIRGNYRASMYMRPAAIWAMEMTALRSSTDTLVCADLNFAQAVPAGSVYSPALVPNLRFLTSNNNLSS